MKKHILSLIILSLSFTALAEPAQKISAEEEALQEWAKNLSSERKTETKTAVKTEKKVAKPAKPKNYRGAVCRRGETDQDLCMVCAVYFEDRQHYNGMVNVARTIITRMKSGRYSRNACGVVYQPGQFSFASHGAQRMGESGVIPSIVKAVEEAKRLGPNHFLGFRSYDNGNCVRIGGNCFRRTAETDGGDELIQMAELIPAQSSPVYGRP